MCRVQGALFCWKRLLPLGNTVCIKGWIWSATIFMQVVCVKITYAWMPEPKPSQQNRASPRGHPGAISFLSKPELSFFFVLFFLATCATVALLLNQTRQASHYIPGTPQKTYCFGNALIQLSTHHNSTRSGITLWPLTGDVNNTDYLFITAPVTGWDILY